MQLRSSRERNREVDCRQHGRETERKKREIERETDRKMEREREGEGEEERREGGRGGNREKRRKKEIEEGGRGVRAVSEGVSWPLLVGQRMRAAWVGHRQKWIKRLAE